MSVKFSPDIRNKSQKRRVFMIVSICLSAVILTATVIFSILFVRLDGSFKKGGWRLEPDKLSMLSALPSERQIAHAETEFYAFFHYGMNTYTDSELGTGKEDPSLFAPSALDTDQWVESIIAAGMKGAIITAKHHDGFCLWPSAYTEFSVKNSPYKNGRGDIVKELSDSCRKYGIKFGFYLSPFDENSPYFGQGDAYNDYFIAQLEELLTNYGPIFEVWFDGFISNEYKGRQSYDWARITDTVRRLQPGAVTAVAPPDRDVAWIGNENGLANGNVTSVKKKKDGTYSWAKNECDVSIRSGWFYHADQEPKPLKQLMNIYYNSVGMNCTLLLNVPPDKSGRIDGKDVSRLAEMGEAIREIYARPSKVKNAAASGAGGDKESVLSIASDDADSVELKDGQYILDFELSEKTKVKNIVLSEDTSNFGERIYEISVYAKYGGVYIKAGTAKSVGEKTVIKINKLIPGTNNYRIVISRAVSNPVIRYIGFYS